MAIAMQDNKYFSANLYSEVFGHRRWLMFAGFVLLLLGITTIIVPLLPALHSTAVLAGLLATSGFMYVLHAVAFWRNRWLGFSLHLLAGMLYAATGYFIFIYPLINIQILAGILIASYVIVGIFRIMTALSQGIANLGWSWTLLGGIINLALSYFIFTQLPTINAGLIALVIGIELAFTGWALFALGNNARRLSAS